MAKGRKGMLFGIALSDDGHTRITKSEDYVLKGGDKEDHERLQEHAAKIVEKHKKRGKQIGECSPQEFHDICREASE